MEKAQIHNIINDKVKKLSQEMDSYRRNRKMKCSPTKKSSHYEGFTEKFYTNFQR
jgi:hypothetical protein